jgi:hypothetical protein
MLLVETSTRGTMARSSYLEIFTWVATPAEHLGSIWWHLGQPNQLCEHVNNFVKGYLLKSV